VEVCFHLGRLPAGVEPTAIPLVLADSALVAEQAGCSWYSLADHFLQLEMMGPIHEPVIEGYTTLGYLAARTTTIELGLLVGGATYRHAGVLAKTVATLDVLSGGRARLGLGAAWYEREHVALGVPFPSVRERFELLDDVVGVCEQMWSDDDGPFHGHHLHLAETVCSPRPLRRPPLIIGGDGERRTLLAVARHADACNVSAAPLDQLAHKLRVLDEHCESVGRDPASVRRTVISSADPLADVDGFLRHMEAAAALGVDEVAIVSMGDPVAIAESIGERLVDPLAAMGP
jgi:F420-dependent oxidoreductase-like protein